MVLRSIPIVAAALAGAAGICPLCLDAPGEAESRTVVGPPTVAIVRAHTDTARVKLAIKGMSCASCATTARIALERSKGVFGAEVSHDSASAVVDYDPKRTSPAQFIATLVTMTGFTAAIVREPQQKG